MTRFAARPGRAAGHPITVTERSANFHLLFMGVDDDAPVRAPLRSSIFKDDDEFALPTPHDESLLQMLYDPRPSTGMTADAARSAVRIVARDPMGQEFRSQADPE